jgi:Ca-activated chloride channel family protein
MATVTFAAVWPLSLLAALPVVWLLAWRNRAGAERARLASATVLRSLVLGAIVAALMLPTLHRLSEDVSVVYALDVSASISPRFVQEALLWIAQVDGQHKPAQSRFEVFAARGKLVDSFAQASSLALAAEDGATSRDDPIGRDATDLEQALLGTLPGFAPGLPKRIVLLTDGNQTHGDVWRAMLRMQAEGARVFAVPAAVSADSDAWVEAIVVPEGVRERAAVEVETRVFSRLRAAARIELSVGERVEASRTVTLSPGDNRISLNVRFPRAGVQTVTARVSATGDQVARNDALTEDILVQPRPRVLYVEGDSHNARYLADALTAQGIRVSVTTAQALSADPDLLANEDLVILSDVRADGLGTDAVERLRAFVRDRGGGLIFAAGQNTYGQEGFAKTEVEQMLPVKFEAKRKRDDLDLVVLVDRSASMRGRKIEVAKSAALATLDLLDEAHRLAVVAFDSQPHDIVPLVPVGDKTQAEDLISRMTSAGQTDIYKALLRAQQLLADSQAKTKHVILLSDGLTAPPPGYVPPPPSNEIEQRIRRVQAEEARQRGGVIEKRASSEPSPLGFPGIVAELAAANITLSTISVGEKPDVELMTNLATWGNGKSYVARSDAEVPTLFAAETHRLLGDSIVEEPFRPQVLGWSPTLAGVDFAGGPKLKGYVASKAKRFADVLLEAKKDQPLLAETHYGLGKTVGFLSDVKNRWAADWLGWPGYARFWAQVVRDSARRDSGEGMSWRVTRDRRDAVVELTAVGHDGSFRHGLWPQVRITAPGGQTGVVALRQIAPGRYRAQVPLTAAGAVPWRFQLLAGAGISAAQVALLGSRRLFYSYPDEYRTLPPNLPLLRTLSEQTGGVFSPKAEEIFRSRGDAGLRTTPLWPYCAGFALLLFLLDILVRRAPWRLGGAP